VKERDTRRTNLQVSESKLTYYGTSEGNVTEIVLGRGILPHIAILKCKDSDNGSDNLIRVNHRIQQANNTWIDTELGLICCVK